MEHKPNTKELTEHEKDKKHRALFDGVRIADDFDGPWQRLLVIAGINAEIGRRG